jgi:polysaccharide export outer membrane protein
MRFVHSSKVLLGVSLIAVALTGCAGSSSGPQLPAASFVASQEGPGEEYIIGPLDQLTIFVWRKCRFALMVVSRRL